MKRFPLTNTLFKSFWTRPHFKIPRLVSMNQQQHYKIQQNTHNMGTIRLNCDGEKKWAHTSSENEGAGRSKPEVGTFRNTITGNSTSNNCCGNGSGFRQFCCGRGIARPLGCPHCVVHRIYEAQCHHPLILCSC